MCKEESDWIDASANVRSVQMCENAPDIVVTCKVKAYNSYGDSNIAVTAPIVVACAGK